MNAPPARYRILRRLGQGGMAEVFEAELSGELGFSRKIAIKRMLGEAATDRDSAQRFLDEARIASRLHHANIVSVLDMGLLDGLPFQVLELVDGINVHQLQSRAGGVLPLDVSLVIISEVAHGLDHAHGATDAQGRPLGIVHRDVKPSNMLVSWGGDVKLTDFGIAFAHEREAKTEAGLVPGTRGFIAPEQRTRSEIDGRTDVFALGLSLHTMLAGYNPLSDITMEMAALSGQPIVLDGMLQPEIRDLIARAVAPQRRDRYTAAQFADAIGAVLARRQVSARLALRQFLAPLHGDKPKPGALDQLLGLDVVLSAEADGEAPSRYELRQTATARPNSAADRATVIGGDAATDRDEPRSEPGPSSSLAPTDRRDERGPSSTIDLRKPDPAASIAETGRLPASDLTAGASYAETARVSELDHPAARRRRSPLLFILAIAIGLVGGFVAWRVATTHRASPIAAVRTDAAAMHEVDPPDASVVVAVADAALATPDAAVAVAVGGHHPRTPSDAGVAHASDPPPKPPVQTGTGFLQIIGEPNVGAKILVDGHEVGYAPNKLEIGRGHHHLAVVRKDGTQAAAEIDVTEYHTLQRPLRLTP